MTQYIHQSSNWPSFQWDVDRILPLLSEVKYKQGLLLGTMNALGFQLKNETLLQTLTLDVLKSSEIEGLVLDVTQVRSSIAKRLGLETVGHVASDRNVDGIVEVMLDATQNFQTALSKERLFDWHAALFPNGRTGIHQITVGDWRNNEKGPMQVVSGAMGREKVHFEAPHSDKLENEMLVFLNWFNNNTEVDSLLKSAIAHLWFITIHPFDDGNGRLARAIADMQLAKADKSVYRFYSVSAQIRIERKQYYQILEQTQKGDLNISDWLVWFLKCIKNALDATDIVLQSALTKARFWEKNSGTILNPRQKLILNKMLDGFEGKLNSSKWAKINKCSTDTALRDINDLIIKGILLKQDSGGRSTSYQLRDL